MTSSTPASSPTARAAAPEAVATTDPAGPMLELRDVTKRYGPVIALDRVSLEIRRGEIFGYIGPNGAGKTTTIKAIVGLLNRFDGEVVVEGRPIRAADRAVARSLGYLPQKAAFQEWRKVDRALRTFGLLSGVSADVLDARIGSVLARLGIADARFRRIVDLSGGTVQKVGMAQAILHRPALLVLDEPMAGLDPVSRHDFKEIFRELRSGGTTILFSTHILSDVEDVADRIGILSRGRLRHSGTIDEFRARFGSPRDVEIVLARDTGRPLGPAVLALLDGVDLVSPGRVRAHVRADVDLDEAIDRLIDGVRAEGHRIRSIRPMVPTLEELYFRFVEGGGA
ncbi:MAG TPA: ABC transporter ATP-binding protein [Thermoplasmata archaeon]|nr:ABC transporter ATP-binding protein [Thermoplasmata archaeon]